MLYKQPPGLVQITHCFHKTNFKILLPQPVSYNLMLRSMLQQISEDFSKKHEKPGIKTPDNKKIYHLNT